MTPTRPVDLDALAELEEERDFLLRSLDDLEAEYEAGDLEADDYETLRDDYTVRAASVIRSIEDQQLSLEVSQSAATSWIRTLAWVAAVVAGVVVAGTLLVQFTGERGAGGTITGEVRTSSREKLFECQELGARFEMVDALQCLDDILRDDPEDVAAVTYRGWYLYLASRSSTDDAQTGELVDLAWVQFERAVAIDPGFSDVLAFRTIVALAQDDPELAATELAAFDASNPPVDMLQLIDGFGIRDRIADAGG